MTGTLVVLVPWLVKFESRLDCRCSENNGPSTGCGWTSNDISTFYFIKARSFCFVAYISWYNCVTWQGLDVVAKFATILGNSGKSCFKTYGVHLFTIFHEQVMQQNMATWPPRRECCTTLTSTTPVWQMLAQQCVCSYITRVLPLGAADHLYMGGYPVNQLLALELNVIPQGDQAGAATSCLIVDCNPSNRVQAAVFNELVLNLTTGILPYHNRGGIVTSK